MARYRKIDVKIWNDEKVKTLSDDAQLLFVFLMTHPHSTGLGAFRATVPGLAAERRWDEARCRVAFAQISAAGMAQHDEQSAFVGLPNFLKYNRPESPNVVRSWPDSFDLIPECRLKIELLARMRGVVEGLGEGFRKAFTEAFGEALPKGCLPPAVSNCDQPSPNQEQEQEQRRDGKPRPSPSEESGKPKKPKSPRFDPTSIEIPSKLDTAAFREAWPLWIAHRIDIKKPLTAVSVGEQMRDFEQWGPDRAVVAIRHTVSRGWTGIREPQSPGMPGQPMPAGGRIPPAKSQNEVVV